MYWKKWGKKRSSGKAKLLRLGAVACALWMLAGTLAAGADRMKELQDRFDKETHATSKIKALDKLTDAQFEAARKSGAAGDYNTAGLILEKYRDNVRAAFELLKKQEPDADKHPGGYRQLELQVRKGIREVEETLVIAPGEMQPPLELVRKDIVEIDDQLIHLLFPRRTKDPLKVPAVREGKQ